MSTSSQSSSRSIGVCSEMFPAEGPYIRYDCCSRSGGSMESYWASHADRSDGSSRVCGVSRDSPSSGPTGGVAGRAVLTQEQTTSSRPWATAMERASLPSGPTNCRSAPASMRMRHMPTCPARDASIRGDQPRGSVALTSTPRRNCSLTAASRPLTAASLKSGLSLPRAEL